MPVDVVEKYSELIDPTMVGIEIGALYTPRLPNNPNVRYLDHASKEELQLKYADNPLAAPRAGEFVDVDYVWKPGMRLADVLGADAPIDFVIASHLLEHIPNPIGWLQQVEEILTEGGVLSLVLPDKRYTFDALRPVTTMSQVVDAYLTDRQLPTYQQIYDHEANFLGEVSALDLWNGLDPNEIDPNRIRRGDVDPDEFAMERCLEMRDTAEYLDVHCSTFTPESFGSIIATAVRLGLIDFEVARLYPTEFGDLEFFVTLRKRDLGTDADRRAAVAAMEQLFAERIASDAGRRSRNHQLLWVSDAEAGLLGRKRQTLGAVRSAVSKVRRYLHDR